MDPKITMIISITFGAIVVMIILFYYPIQNDVLVDDESNPCDNSHLTNYEEDPQFPLDKTNILNTWDQAKKIPTVKNVVEPSYIPNGFEFKFLYYDYHKVQAHYGLIAEDFDMNVICPRDYYVNGFVIEYDDDSPVIYSELLDLKEKNKILKFLELDLAQ